MTLDARSFWSEHSTKFVNAAGEPDSFYARRTALVAETAAQRAHGIRALDLGCGAGHLCSALAKRGFDVYGVDISPMQIDAAIAALRSLTPQPEHRVRVADAAAMPFAGCFDVITSIGLLPYIADHEEFVARAMARLAPRGLLLMSCTNRLSLFTARAIARHVGSFAPNSEWCEVLRNLLRTGVWSGGFVDVRLARQCRSAAALDRLCARSGLALEQAIDLFNIEWGGLDRRPLKRCACGRLSARHFGWCHIGAYRRLDHGPTA